MNKQIPSPARILVMVVFALSCFGLLLFLWLAFGGPTPLKPKGYRFTVSFAETAQLAKEADVRISGVPVGKVRDVQANQRTGRSDATIELDSTYAPIPSDARAILRAKTLLGETYVELTPGTPSAPKLPDGGQLRSSQVARTVELDEIFRALDPKTREALRTWLAQQADSIDGRGRDLSDALGNLPPFARDTERLLTLLNSQQGAVRSLVHNTGVVFDALSERRQALQGVITNSNRVFETTARRDVELQQAFKALPTFEKESTLTVKRLSKFSTDTNPLITTLRPWGREFSPTVQSLAKVAPDLHGLLRGLGQTIDASQQGLPATKRFLDNLRGVLPEFDPFVRQLNPILDGASLYKDELTAFFANSTAATQGTGIVASGKQKHYLRTTNPLNPEGLAQVPQRLGSNRSNPYQLPSAFANLAAGLPVFLNAQCGRGTQITLGDPVAGLMDADLRERIIKYALSGGDVPAPTCRLQPRYAVSGKVTQYPQVEADVHGVRAGLPQP